MANEKLSEAGQFDLKKLVLTTSEGIEVDLSVSVNEIILFESIDSNSISGYINIFDTIGLNNAGPLIGMEYLQIVIATSSMKEKKLQINFDENVLHVIRVVQRVADGNNTVTTLEFVSSELIHSRRTKVNRSLKGSYAELYTAIMQSDLNCKKDLYVESTSGIKQIIAPNLTPFNLFKTFTLKAVGSEHGTPTFHQYENMKGHNFRSIESMYAEGSKATYTESDAGAPVGDTPGLSSGPDMDKKLTKDLETILEFEIKSSRNFLELAPMGALASTLIQHDIIYKNLTITGYNYFANFEPELKKIDNKRKSINFFSGDKDQPLYNNAVVDLQDRRITDFNYTVFVAPTSTIKNKDNVKMDSQFDVHDGEERRYSFEPRRSESWLQTRRGLLINLNSSGTIVMTVHGNTSIVAGDVITVNLKESGSNKSTEDGFDKFYKGNFLIRTLKHTFKFGENKHTMLLECNKDSVTEPFDSDEGFVEPKPTKIGNVFSNEDFYGGSQDYDE